FPTRRSSDLVASGRPNAAVRAGPAAWPASRIAWASASSPGRTRKLARVPRIDTAAARACSNTPMERMQMDTSKAAGGIAVVGFDGDDTLWRSQDFYDEAQARFEEMLGHYIDLGDVRLHERLYAVEKGNIALFGYGVKGMVLSMIESAVQLTDGRISATDLQRVVQ